MPPTSVIHKMHDPRIPFNLTREGQPFTEFIKIIPPMFIIKNAMNGSLVGRQIGGLLGDGEVPKEFTVYEYVTAGKNQLKSVTSILIEEVLEVPWIELDR